MPVQTTYPGVYIEEVPSGVHTITGVSTSIAAFVGFFNYGLMNYPTHLMSMSDFERELGGLAPNGEASYGVRQFFLNGGSEAYGIRVANGALEATISLQSNVTVNEEGNVVLVLQAGRFEPNDFPNTINPGNWANRLRVIVSYPEPASNNLFDLAFQLTETRNSREIVLDSEQFLGLSMTATHPRFVRRVINDRFNGSKWLRVSTVSGNARPVANGTLSGDLSTFPTLTGSPVSLTVDINGFSNVISLPRVPTTLQQARNLIQEAIRNSAPANPLFSQINVSIVDNRLLFLAGPGIENDIVVKFTASTGDSTSVNRLRLSSASATNNIQNYRAGTHIVQSAQGDGQTGTNGNPPGPAEIIGSHAQKNGIYALENVDLFNILCIPRTSNLNMTEYNAVVSVANTYCATRRAFFILDIPSAVNDTNEMKDWIDQWSNLRSTNSAIYFPRIEIPDPLDEFRTRKISSSGTMAGLYARTDIARGVWKAPAGTEAKLNNVVGLDYMLTENETGVLNPIGINCIRSFPLEGCISWGARTSMGANQLPSDWRYVQIRRLALFIEESLYRGTKWVVFEPNDEPLWAKIRMNVGAFMKRLFRQGAFQGSTPSQAYFVKCDAETTTQADRNLGIINIEVGFAPLIPAEFVIVRIRQIAGDL